MLCITKMDLVDLTTWPFSLCFQMQFMVLYSANERLRGRGAGSGSERGVSRGHGAAFLTSGKA